jgi:hypothetical protein
MDKSTAIVLVAGLGGGAAIGYIARGAIAGGALGLPADFSAQAARLTFYDTVQGTLAGPVLLNIRVSSGYTWAECAYGLGTGSGVDIILQIVKRPDGTFYCNIVKLGSDPVDVYLDGAKQNTLPSYSGVPGNTLEPGYMVLAL